MIDELNHAITTYELKWRELCAGRKLREEFEALKPTSVAWKTLDPADFDKRFVQLRMVSDQIHLGWVNERWLATFHLRDQKLHWNITVVKLMMRRPGSTDAVGLDHLDFMLPDEHLGAKIKADEDGLKITEERNGDHCEWLSVWFHDTEAKLRSDTVLDVCIDEMQDCNKLVKGH
jgi:hypothetical protein